MSIWLRLWKTSIKMESPNSVKQFCWMGRKMTLIGPNNFKKKVKMEKKKTGEWMNHLLLRQRRVLRRWLENFLHRWEPAASFLSHLRGKDLLLTSTTTFITCSIPIQNMLYGILEKLDFHSTNPNNTTLGHVIMLLHS